MPEESDSNSEAEIGDTGSGDVSGEAVETGGEEETGNVSEEAGEIGDNEPIEVKTSKSMWTVSKFPTMKVKPAVKIPAAEMLAERLEMPAAEMSAERLEKPAAAEMLWHWKAFSHCRFWWLGRRSSCCNCGCRDCRCSLNTCSCYTVSS